MSHIQFPYIICKPNVQYEQSGFRREKLVREVSIKNKLAYALGRGRIPEVQKKDTSTMFLFAAKRKMRKSRNEKFYFQRKARNENPILQNLRLIDYELMKNEEMVERSGTGHNNNNCYPLRKTYFATLHSIFFLRTKEQQFPNFNSNLSSISIGILWQRLICHRNNIVHVCQPTFFKQKCLSNQRGFLPTENFFFFGDFLAHQKIRAPIILQKKGERSILASGILH